MPARFGTGDTNDTELVTDGQRRIAIKADGAPLVLYNQAGTEVARVTTAGNLAVGTATSPYGSATRAMTLEAATFPAFELASTRADADAQALAVLDGRYQTNESTHQIVSRIGIYSDGATANQRGGQLRFLTKANASTTLVERMRINEAGAVTVSGLAGSGNRAVYSDPNGVLTNSASDARLKTDVEEIADPLALVGQLHGVYHAWVDPARGEGRQLGLLAQEVQAVLPEVVGTNADGFLSVDYPKIVAALIEAVKVLTQKVALLESR